MTSASDEAQPDVTAKEDSQDLDEMSSEDSLEPISLRSRLWAAAGVGAWVGGLLGLVGFLIGSAFWADGTIADGDGPFSPSIVISVSTLIWGAALVSIPFGALTASVARAATTWAHPAMRLRSSPTTTAWVGAGCGVILGVIAGAVLGMGVGTPVEGAEGMAQLPVVVTLATMALGGAVLGAAAALAGQVFAVPVVVAEDTEEEVTTIRSRLRDAVRVPLTALIIIVCLVIPLGFTLVEASHLGEFAAPVIAMIVAGGVLGFASLSASRPNMRITVGEFGVALVGILVVVGLVLAVLFERGPVAPEVHGPGGTVEIAATADFTFEPPDWAVPEGEVTFVYTDEADTTHTLVIEGMEDQMELRVDGEGAVDEGTVNLPPGTYTLFCTIKGHRELGMEGQLTVERAPEESAPPEG